MRADMAKVLVERPRPGSREGARPRKGYRKAVGRALAAGDPPPAREGMKARYGGNRRFFNEHLGPLRRFLDANVGRPWDKVHAEICARVDRGNVVQNHILTHLYDYVIRHALLVDGVPCHGGPGWAYGRPLADAVWSRHAWYVCPRTGLLRRVRGARDWKRRRREEQAAEARRRADRPAPVVVGPRLVCCWNEDGWDLVTLAPLRPCGAPGEWPVLEEARRDAVRAYGTAGQEVSRRRLRRRELKDYPIPIDTWARHRP